MIQFKSTKSATVQEQKKIGTNEHIRNTLIDNYYGAHKNFKTDFRNKKFKNVYTQLIHRKPSQQEHRGLYYQDVLISIIKTVQASFVGKDNQIDSIDPFFYFGTRAINQFYWYFLKERRIIDSELMINPEIKSRISNFLTLLIDFSCKIAQYFRVNGNTQNSQRIFKTCYQCIVKMVINSSTSNILLLKKCGQFLVQYGMHCLKTQKIEKANQIIKYGLKTQLNQLLLLKSSEKNKKKQKKFCKKYASAVKSLANFYLSLALYYQKAQKPFQCATIVLDAVLLEQLACCYNKKTKKWICNLQYVYNEEKVKYLELMRICKTFFSTNFINQINEQAKQKQKQRQKLKNKQQAQKSLKDFKHINSKGILLVQQNKSKQKQYKSKSQKYFKSKQIKLAGESENTVKQVRFQLNQDPIKDRTVLANAEFVEKENYFDCMLSLDSMIKGQQVFNQKVNVQEIKKIREVSNTSHDTDEIQKTCKRSKSCVVKRLKSTETNQFFIFGENFWESQQTTKRSKSNYEKNKSYKQIAVKKTGRKLSYTNLSYLQAQKNNQSLKNRNISIFLKQNLLGGNQIKKRSNKQKGLFLLKKQQIPDNFNNVNQKIKEWHYKSSKIQTDLAYKIQKLKQKNRKKNGLQNFDQSQQIETSHQMQQKHLELFSINQKTKKNQLAESKKQSTSLTGVKLFKQFLIENKSYFNISKIQLYNTNFDLEGQKRYLSFLIAEKPEKVEKYIQKNHKQAKNNVLFFIKQIENSNKKLKKGGGKQIKKIQYLSKKEDDRKMELNEAIQLQQFQSVPSNLFATSLKSRVAQIVNYL